MKPVAWKRPRLAFRGASPLVPERSSKVVMARAATRDYGARRHPRHIEASNMRKIANGLLIGVLAGSVAGSISAAEPSPPATASHAGNHDFDFEFGDWTMQLSRRVKPLSGSNEWVKYEGTSVVHKVWNGAANIGEIELDGPKGHIQGMTLRVYNPDAKQWNVRFANSASGVLGDAMVGGFHDGRGEFYDQETYDGRAVFVRFVFSDITQNTFKFEQAFSDDGGRTWEANWIATFRRVGS
jgi:hypothetical protein